MANIKDTALSFGAVEKIAKHNFSCEDYYYLIRLTDKGELEFYKFTYIDIDVCHDECVFLIQAPECEENERFHPVIKHPEILEVVIPFKDYGSKFLIIDELQFDRLDFISLRYKEEHN